MNVIKQESVQILNEIEYINNMKEFEIDSDHMDSDSSGQHSETDEVNKIKKVQKKNRIASLIS